MTPTFENPIIFCDEHQLLWSAWQTAQGIPEERQQDDDDSDNRRVFDAWYEFGVSGPPGTGLNGKSMLLACLEAWTMGASVSTASVNTPSSFLAWWQRLLKSQPIPGTTP